MDFKSLSIRTNASVLVSGVIGIGMAVAGFRVWALVGQQIARDLTALVLLWRLSPWRPRFEFSWRHLKELLGFSVPNFTAQLANFADSQASSVLLGLLFGPLALGLYRLADRFVNCVVVMATSSIQAVSLPEFSRLQDNPKELRRSALSCIRLSASVTLPALAGLAAISGPLMATMGAQWTPASIALKILSFAGMAIIFAYFTGPLMQALGRTHQLAVLEWLRTALGVALLTTVGFLVRSAPTNEQLIGVALARLVPAALIISPVFLYILMRLCEISIRDLTIAIGPAVVASGAVIAVVALVWYSGLFGSGKPAPLLVLEVMTGGASGLLVLVSLDTELRVAVAAMLHRLFGSRLLHVQAD